MGCRTLNSAGFLSLRDDSPPEEEDEQQQFGQVAVVCFFCGWLVGRCFSLAVHCSVVLFRLIIWFRFDSYTVSGRSTCIGTGRSGSCQLRSAHPSARSGCFSCCACGGHLCTLCLSSCDRGLYQGTNLQLGWCGYGWVDHVKRHPSLSSKRDVLNLRGEHVWEIQMFVGSKGNLSLKDRGAMPRHIIFRDVGSIHTRKYIYRILEYVCFLHFFLDHLIDIPFLGILGQVWSTPSNLTLFYIFAGLLGCL